MTNYTELKRLAEGAVHAGDHWGLRDSFERQLAKLVSPETLLALIAENERLESERADLWRGKRDAEATRDTKSAVIAELKAEIAGLRTGYEAYERVNAELKAENEALRKDAERYRYLRDRCGLVEYKAFAGSIGPGMLPSGEALDAAIDAAMGKGDRS